MLERSTNDVRDVTSHAQKVAQAAGSSEVGARELLVALATEPAGAEMVSDLPHCLLIVRHGRTVWNDQDRMSTRTDLALTDVGRTQARRLGTALTGAVFDYAWCSPLARSRETAQLTLEHAASPGAVTDARLVEPDAGPFEGLTFTELERGELARAFAAYQDEQEPVFPPGATPLSESLAQAAAFLADVGARPGRHFAVSHGALIRILASGFLGMPVTRYRRLRCDNCHGALCKFYPEPPHQLVGWNLPSG